MSVLQTTMTYRNGDGKLYYKDGTLAVVSGNIVSKASDTLEVAFDFVESLDPATDYPSGFDLEFIHYTPPVGQVSAQHDVDSAIESEVPSVDPYELDLSALTVDRWYYVRATSVDDEEVIFASPRFYLVA